MASLNVVSCPAAGACVAVGEYQDTTGGRPLPAPVVGIAAAR